REVLVLDVDEFLSVAGLGYGAGRDDGNDVAGEGDLIDRDRRARRRLLIRGDGPGVRQTSLDIGEVGSGEHGDDPGGVLRLGHIDGEDLRVGYGAAHHRQVQHARQGNVVREA